MIYIVSGYMRCGTSMMMEALIAGGMDAVYCEKRAKTMNDKWGEDDKVHGYQPNKEYYELNTNDYKALYFPQGFEGKLIKCLWRGAAVVNVGEYRLIFMRRPREDIERSLIAVFGRANPVVKMPSFDASLDNLVETIRDRRSFLSVDEVWYRDVVKHPLAVFQHLKKQGWPIDPVKAAAIPTASKVRYTA